MKSILLVVGVVLVCVGAEAQDKPAFKPMRSLSPGVVDSGFKGPVCPYTPQVTVRIVTDENVKAKVFAAYGINGAQRSDYIMDSVVPESLGGRRVARNAWPHLTRGPWNVGDKQKLTEVLITKVCAHELDLKVAQQALMQDWTAAYEKYVGDYPGK